MALMEKEHLKNQDSSDNGALKKLIEQGLKKIQGSKEKDLCKYLPGPSGGYIHHFTFRKLKKSDPQKAVALIKKFIIDSESPKTIEPKPRAPRGLRTRRDLINFSRSDIEKILDLARKVGDRDLLARFSPKRSLATLKKELIRSIKNHSIDQDLWNAYSEAISNQSTLKQENNE